MHRLTRSLQAVSYRACPTETQEGEPIGIERLTAVRCLGA